MMEAFFIHNRVEMIQLLSLGGKVDGHGLNIKKLPFFSSKLMQIRMVGVIINDFRPKMERGPYFFDSG